MVTNYGEWLTEASVQKIEDNAKFVKSFLAELDSRDVDYTLKSTATQLKRGTIVLAFEGPTTIKIVEKAIKTYNLPSNFIIPSKEEECFTKLNSGTLYKIFSHGATKHHTRPGYAFTFDPVNNIPDSVDWLINNAMRYLLGQICAYSYTDYVSKSIDDKLVYPEFFKDYFDEESYDKIFEFSENFPNAYEAVSTSILFFIILMKIRNLPSPKLVNKWLFKLSPHPKQFTAPILSLDLVTSISVLNSTLTSKYVVELPFLTADESRILADVKKNPRSVEEILHDHRGTISGAKYNI